MSTRIGQEAACLARDEHCPCAVTSTPFVSPQLVGTSPASSSWLCARSHSSPSSSASFPPWISHSPAAPAGARFSWRALPPPEAAVRLPPPHLESRSRPAP